MKIVIPMAGEGRRFLDAGYTTNKALLPMVYRKTGERCPMVVCSVKDLPGLAPDGGNLAFVMRENFLQMGVDREIRRFYPAATVFTVPGLTQGQACTCLAARSFFPDDEELLLAACDNGIEYDPAAFEARKAENDVLVFTYRHDPRVCDNPDAFGWVRVDEAGHVTGMSVKKHISDHPEEDHAVVATFWFRRAGIFVQAAEKMIAEDDRINNEFYVDEVLRHVVELGYRASVFEVGRFLNYGAPADYENYLRTIEHFKGFMSTDRFYGGLRHVVPFGDQPGLCHQ